MTIDITHADALRPAERPSTVDRLQDAVTHAMRGLLPGSRPFALLDFPDHPNVGDSAIYAGEIVFLARNGLRPSFVSTIHSHDWVALERAIGSGPILLHGGGNFGDVWPAQQAFRELVIARCPDNPIVQLPQTVFFQSQLAIEQAARVIERHRAFTMLVRDDRSFELARKWFPCDVRLSPDMAHFLGPLRRAVPTHDLVVQFRADHESTRRHQLGPLAGDPAVLVSDWPEEPAGFRRRTGVLDAMPLATALLSGPNSFREARHRLLAGRRLQRGLDLLSSGRAVITDRLHGHILSSLLGLPHCVLDNSYGKTSSYMQTWGMDAKTTLVGTFDEAVTWYQSLPAGQDGRAAA